MSKDMQIEKLYGYEKTNIQVSKNVQQLL